MDPETSMDGEVLDPIPEVVEEPVEEVVKQSTEEVEEEAEEIEEFYPQFLEEDDRQDTRGYDGRFYQGPQVPYQPQIPPQQTPAQRKKLDVNRFVEDPEGAIEEVVQTRLQQELNKVMAPLAYRQEVIAQQAMAHMQARATESVNKASDSIRGMYKNVFSKDDAYRSSKAVRAKIDNFINDTVKQAKQAAAQGNPWGFSTLQSFSNPNFAHAALAIAKLEEGYQGKPKPVKMAGLQSEGARKRQPEKTVTIDPSTEEALRRRFGPGYLERYKKAIAQYGDDAVNAF